MSQNVTERPRTSQLATLFDAIESCQSDHESASDIDPFAHSLTVSDKLMMKSLKDYDRDPKK